MRTALGLLAAALIASAPGLAPAQSIDVHGTTVAATAPLRATALGSTDTVSLAPSVTAQPTYGLYLFGDSITQGAGCSVSTNCYAQLLKSDFVLNNGKFFDEGESGEGVGDLSYYMFADLPRPGDTHDPIVTALEGTNDIGLANGIYDLFYDAALSGAAVSSTNTVMASAMTATGAWSADSLFANFPGLASAENGDTLAIGAAYAEQGVIYVWYGAYASSGGAFTVSIDGSVATDTITGLSTIASQPPRLPFPSSYGHTEAVGLARYVVTPGTHSISIAVTSATGAGNPVTIFGVGLPPKGRTGGAMGPKVFAGGVIYQENDASSALTAAADYRNRSQVALLQGDGLDVTFVDVRQYLDPALDMSGSAVQNCPASTAPGLHPNDCGHRQIADAFEDAINPIVTTLGNPVLGSPINLAALSAPSTLNLASGGAATTDGSTLAPGSWCASIIGQYCFGLTHVYTGAVEYTVLTTSNSALAGGVAFSATPTAPAFSDVTGGVFAKFKYDGTFNIGTAAHALNGDASGNLTANSLAATAFVRVSPSTVSGLATGDPTPHDDDRAYVTDATACSFGSAVTGGGSVRCPVYYDAAATAWKAG